MCLKSRVMLLDPSDLGSANLIIKTTGVEHWTFYNSNMANMSEINVILNKGYGPFLKYILLKSS